MALYVDHARIKLKEFTKSHMVADTIEELHSAAEIMWIPRRAYGVSELGMPHYAISESIRKMAVSMGAHEISEEDMRKMAERFRLENGLDVPLTNNKEEQ